WMTRLGRQVLQSATEVVDDADDLPAGTAASWGFDPTGYHPDVALVNHYDEQSKMGMHQDKDEFDPAPVVSLSLGDTCLLWVSNTEHRNPTNEDLGPASLDVLVFGGLARFAIHGVRSIQSGTAPDYGRLSHLGGGRIKITVRTTSRE